MRRSNAENLTSMKDITKLRVLSVLSVLAHIGVAAQIMMMGFSKNAESTKEADQEAQGTQFSTTIVFCAFVGLVTALWAGVAAWEIWSGTADGQTPGWGWFNRQFMLGLAVVFVTILAHLPSLMLYVLHSFGTDVFDLYSLLEPGERTITVFHGVVSLILGFYLIGSIIYTSRLLYLAQLESEEATEDDDDADAAKPIVPQSVKVMVYGQLLINSIIIIDLISVAAYAPSSGTIGATLFMMALMANTARLARKSMCYAGHLDYEHWLVSWRVGLSLQIFTNYVMAWISFGTLILRTAHDTRFFEAVFGNLPSSKAALVIISMVCLLFYVVIYALLLHTHTSCMAKLDDEASMKILEMEDMGEGDLNRASAASTGVAMRRGSSIQIS